MKIGFMRFNFPVELDLMQGSIKTLGTELRVGILHDWIELGHDVTIYTPIKNRDKPLVTQQVRLTDEYPWMKKISYEPGGDPSGEDVLFIENAPTSTVISAEGESCIRRTLRQIDKFSGRVVYYQHGHFNFPFGDSVAETTSDSELNLRVMMDENDIWKDKDWMVLTHMMNMDKFVNETKCRNEMTYEDFSDRVDFKHIPVGYSDSDPWFDVKEKPEWDSLFIGGQVDSNKKGKSTKGKNSRFDMAKNYYDIAGFDNVIIGGWNEGVVDKFNHLNYLGSRGKHGDAYRFWNDAYTCVWSQSEEASALGMLPSRPVMVLRGGAICLAGYKTWGINEFYDDDWIVTPKTVEDKVSEVKGMSAEERDELRRDLLSNFPRWKDIDWEGVFGL